MEDERSRLRAAPATDQCAKALVSVTNAWANFPTFFDVSIFAFAIKTSVSDI
jgi:hypothetical protein